LAFSFGITIIAQPCKGQLRGELSLIGSQILFFGPTALLPAESV